MEVKERIRKSILAKRNALSEVQRAQQSEAIIRKIIEFDCFQRAKHILVYQSFGSEVNMEGVLQQGWLDKKEIYVPKVEGDVISFYQIKKDTKMNIGKYGIKEPLGDTKRYAQTEEATLVIMPGVVFDVSGNRMGYGKGYYDRFLCEHTEVVRLAVGFSCQVIDFIPHESWDISWQWLVTPECIYQKEVSK